MKYRILFPLKDTTTLAEALWLYQEYGFEYDVDNHCLILAKVEYTTTTHIAKNIFKQKLDYEK